MASNPFVCRSIVRRCGGLAAFSCLCVALLLAGFGRAQAQEGGARSSPPYDAADVSVPASPPLGILGESIYQENCAPCHGSAGMGDGPDAARLIELSGPPTAFADPAAVRDRMPAQLFHTTKFGRLEKLMPPWQNSLSDEQIWQAVAYAWSLHSSPAASERGAALYAESCAACHGPQGGGDGPEAEGDLNDFGDQSYAIFRSQADWDAGWQAAHPEIGAEWTANEQSDTLEFVRGFSLWPPWQTAYQAGDGVITGQVVQGTADAPAPAELPITLEAYIGFEPLTVFTSTVGADGTFRFEELATDPNINYLATVATDGISYSSDFLTLSPVTRTLQAQVAIYATTDDAQNVRINRSHWIVDQQPGAILGGAIYIFGNDGDRTITGRAVEGSDQLVTVAMQVPPGAVEIALDGGAIGERYVQVGDTIYDTLPLLPGPNTRQIVVRYAIPFEGAELDLQQEFLHPVDQLSLLVASTPGLQVEAPGMEAAGPQDMGGQAYELFRLADFAPRTIDVRMRGLLPAGSADPRTEAAAGAAGGSESAGAVGLGEAAAPLAASATWVMAGLIVAALLGVLGVALQRGALASQPTRQTLYEQREALLGRLAQLDDARALGTINPNEWMRQRAYLKAQLVDVMQRIDRNATHKEAADA
jgi:mono/diheme cytochrome c family protein